MGRGIFLGTEGLQATCLHGQEDGGRPRPNTRSHMHDQNVIIKKNKGDLND